MPNDAFGLLSTAPAMQPCLAALDRAESDADLMRFLVEYAVLFTDLSGFSAHPILVHALQRVRQMERALATFCETAGGQVVKALGDSHLLLFDFVDQALGCVETLRGAMPTNPFCAGIGYGPMLVCRHTHGRLDAFSSEVSAASRLGEDIATGSQILLTPAAYARIVLPGLKARCQPRGSDALQYWELA